MDEKITEFTRDVENLIRSARQDTTDALCAISHTERSFELAAAGLRERVLRIPPQAPPAFTAPLALPSGRRVTRRELGMVFLVAVAAALVAFAAGYVMGLPADQRFRSRKR